MNNNTKEINAALDIAIRSLQNLMVVLDNFKEELNPKVIPPTTPPAKFVPPLPSAVVAKGSELETLKAFLDNWPAAIDPLLICQKEDLTERQERAEQILDALMEDPIAGKNFLDFGCGTGETVAAALKRGVNKAMGYDITPFDGSDANLVNDFKLLQGPYDVVLLYDVIDHIVNEDPTAVLNKLRGILNKDATVYVRCHPWVSRHGGHLYKTFNKEYAHLIFTAPELEEMGYKLEPVRKVFYPRATYQRMFKQSGFKVTKELVINDNIPQNSYLRNAPFVDRIRRNWDKYPNQFPEVQMSMSFIDYILKIA